MAKIKFTGIEDYMKQINALNKNSDAIIKPAVYNGAAVVAKAFVEELNAIPVAKDEDWGSERYPVFGLWKEQKQGLIDGFGISTMQNESGYINVKIGFDGYNDVKIFKKYPNGQPNAMVARSLAKGTSFSKKYPFAKRAIAKSKKACVDEMQATIDEKIYQIMR